MAGPLENLRVLDLSRILAGPWASQLLADYGADVLKVEKPCTGDDTRHWGPPWLDGEGSDSAYFLAANRNKRSITVNLAATAGQQIIRELVQQSDVLLENFRVGTLERLGLGPEAMLALNPRLIYCSISAFGQSGSKAKEPGYDAMIQASAGLMSVTGPADDKDGGPQKVGVAVSDIMAGMYASTAILAALHSRSADGQGQYIDVPLYDSQVAWLANQNMNFLLGGKVPKRMGTAHPNLVPYQAFQTSDGELMLAVGNDKQFETCCTVLGLSELAGDERFLRMADRLLHRDVLIAEFSRRLLQETTSEWLTRLRTAGIPAGPINDVGEVLSNAYAEEKELVRQIDNSNGVSVPTVANPVGFRNTPVSYDLAPPMLGEHTFSVLEERLGYSLEQIETLQEEGVI